MDFRPGESYLELALLIVYRITSRHRKVKVREEWRGTRSRGMRLNNVWKDMTILILKVIMIDSVGYFVFFARKQI